MSSKIPKRPRPEASIRLQRTDLTGKKREEKTRKAPQKISEVVRSSVE